MRGVLTLVLVIATLASCGSGKQRIDAAYREWSTVMEDGASDAEQVAAAKDFLQQFPDTEHTREVAGNAVYLLSEKLGDATGADALLVDLNERVRTTETRTALAGMRLGVLAKLRRTDALRVAAEEYTAGRELRYGDHQRVFEAALECGDWDLALAHAERALPLSTAEAFLADNEKRKPSEQRITDGARRRRVGALAARGWALANLGRLEEALPVLEEAHDTDFSGYMGNRESAAGSYLGRALAMAGRCAKAEPVLVVEALYGGDPAARKALLDCHTAAAGETDFDAYLGQARRRMARPIDDFTLPDYGSVTHRFSDLHNGEVALLAFWFPT